MYERSHVSVKVEPRSTSRLISTRVIGNQPLVVLARETALFWREKSDSGRLSSTSFSENAVVLEVLSFFDRERA